MIVLLIILATLVVVAITHERDPEKKMHLQEWRHHHSYRNGNNQNRDTEK